MMENVTPNGNQRDPEVDVFYVLGFIDFDFGKSRNTGYR